MRYYKPSITGPLVIWGFALAILVGYVMNFITVIQMAETSVLEMTTFNILRLIGVVVVPFGGILGYF